MHNFTYSDISSKIFESSSMLNSVTCKMFGGLLAFKAYFQFLPQHLSWSQMWALTRPLVSPHNTAFLLLFERFFGGFTSVSLKAPRHLLDRWPHIIFKHSLLWFRQTNQVPLPQSLRQGNKPRLLHSHCHASQVNWASSPKNLPLVVAQTCLLLL